MAAFSLIVMASKIGHVLKYTREGLVAVAEPGAIASVSLLRALKREFGFYCIELNAEPEPEQPGTACVIGGANLHDLSVLSSKERYDILSGQWSAVAPMGTARHGFGVCAFAGEIYVTGGRKTLGGQALTSVEKYTPSTDTWSALTPMPVASYLHSTVAVGSALYLLGGRGSSGVIVRKCDIAEGNWSEVAPLPQPRFESATCAVGSDINVFGGFLSVFKYDTLTTSWSSLALMPYNCYKNAVYMNGLVYLPAAGNSRPGKLCALTQHRAHAAHWLRCSLERRNALLSLFLALFMPYM
jgi:hypothetical protein